MAKREGIEISIAISEAAKLCDVDIISAYPITPQTHIVEHLSEIVANGELDAEFIPVESEHTAMSVCCGSSASGARTFTATSSQGLALMHEILYIASAMRLPIVMAVANRALSAPINIWNDHSDVMAERDTGWIQMFADNGQEAYDMIFQAFRIGEDREVALPVMVNFDGFIMSHVIEPIIIFESKDEIKPYLPPFSPLVRLDVDNPVTMGPVGIPEVYTESKKAHEFVLQNSYKTILKGFSEFEKLYGRSYAPLKTYGAKDAEVLLLTMGSIGETAREVVDALNKEGKKVAQVSLHLWRPFPKEDFIKTVSRAKVLGIVDRCLSTGGGSAPVAAELKAALYNEERRPKVVEFVAGLGGRDVSKSDFRRMFDVLNGVSKGEKIPPPQMIGVRE
ncbi:MAG: pyruvate synthase subunit PorA [Myxococcota bacterium]